MSMHMGYENDTSGPYRHENNSPYMSELSEFENPSEPDGSADLRKAL